MLRFNNVVQIIKAFDKDLEVVRAPGNDLYLFVKTNKHKYYLGIINLDELNDKKDLMCYLDVIKVKEI